jgi:hypothetical protein
MSPDLVSQLQSAASDPPLDARERRKYLPFGITSHGRSLEARANEQAVRESHNN